MLSSNSTGGARILTVQSARDGGRKTTVALLARRVGFDAVSTCRRSESDPNFSRVRCRCRRLRAAAKYNRSELAHKTCCCALPFALHRFPVTMEISLAALASVRRPAWTIRLVRAWWRRRQSPFRGKMLVNRLRGNRTDGFSHTTTPSHYGQPLAYYLRKIREMV